MFSRDRMPIKIVFACSYNGRQRVTRTIPSLVVKRFVLQHPMLTERTTDLAKAHKVSVDKPIFKCLAWVDRKLGNDVLNFNTVVVNAGAIGGFEFAQFGVGSEKGAVC